MENNEQQKQQTFLECGISEKKKQTLQKAGNNADIDILCIFNEKKPIKVLDSTARTAFDVILVFPFLYYLLL